MLETLQKTIGLGGTPARCWNVKETENSKGKFEGPIVGPVPPEARKGPRPPPAATRPDLLGFTISHGTPGPWTSRGYILCKYKHNIT